MVMILAAVLLSVGAGVILPFELFFTGTLYNIFISFNTAQDIRSFVVNQSNVTCTLQRAREFLNIAAENNSDRIFCDAFEEGNIISRASTYICDPDKTLTEEATTFSLYFVYLAIANFVVLFLAHILWTISAYRQSHRLRVLLYRAILRHDIAWFDTNDLSRLGPTFLK